MELIDNIENAILFCEEYGQTLSNLETTDIINKPIITSIDEELPAELSDLIGEISKGLFVINPKLGKELLDTLKIRTLLDADFYSRLERKLEFIKETINNGNG